MERDTAMEMSLSEKLMYTTVLIKCEYQGGISGSGTGFVFNFLKRGDTSIPAIVTNRHVVHGATRIEFELCLRNDDGSPDDKHVFAIKAPPEAWIEHPDGIDLCCFLIGGALNEAERKGVHLFFLGMDASFVPSEEDLKNLYAMESITMVGYPIGLSDEFNHKPILRRGITASHLKNDYMGRKEFLVDMACFPGSSGSPIFILNEGFYANRNALTAGSRVLLVGILWGGPQHDASGEIVSYAIPNFATNTKIPTNLGFAIKASQLLSFEEKLKKRIGQGR